jgi:hypothetical protein
MNDQGQVKILDLPWRLRLKFWRDHQINAIGIWLVDHGHPEAAICFWKLCRTW